MPNIDFNSVIFGASIGGILGFLLREVTSHWLAKDRARQSRLADIRNIAAIRFKESFIDVKLLLNPKSFAVNTKPYIPDSDINKFKLAWSEYTGDSKNLEQYASPNMFENKKRKDLALSRIEKLLSFAKEIH